MTPDCCRGFLGKTLGNLRNFHRISTNFPTYFWKIASQPPVEIKGVFTFESLGMSGICSRGMLGVS